MGRRGSVCAPVVVYEKLESNFKLHVLSALMRTMTFYCVQASVRVHARDFN